MGNYLVGEIYRLLHKKSFYFYFGALALAYLLLTFIRIDGQGGAEQMLGDAETLFMLLPPVLGGYLFSAVYTDDLNARNLGTLIGFGMSKAMIVLVKVCIMALFSIVLVGLVPLYMTGIYTVMGSSIPSEILGMTYGIGLKALLQIVAYGSLAAIVVYGLQRATFGVVTYLLLSLGVVSQLLSALLRWEPIQNALPGLTDHLMAGISMRIQTGIIVGGSILWPVAEYIIYVAATIALSILAFRKKELEF